MFRFITETFHRLIDELPTLPTRYLYPQFQLRNRLTGLVGPRGVGKTTLLLQYIKNELMRDKETFYFSADIVYFQQSKLLEFVSDLHLKEGYKIIFIDEIHKYQGWDQELKNIYDSFPSLKIVFSGSSMLDLVAGSHDLSRRAKLYRLQGLSFREYLNFSQKLHLAPCTFQELLQGAAVPELPKILTYFETYLTQGYYPFVFEDPHSYHEKVSRIIEKTITEDIANFYNLKTSNLQHFKKILTYLASIPPGEVNIHNLSQNLSIDHKTTQHYLSILAAVGLIRELHPYEGGGAGLRKPSKFLLNNTTLMHTMQQYLGQPILKGTERELFFIQSLQNAEIPVFCSDKVDYRTRDALFEIGGRSKTTRQLKGAHLPAYLVKDDILHPFKNEIPLFHCGFLY
ncbi:MAG TPA: AAA family ATPase [Chlamydiales bacterium]|nr:AAA family ATPase [Chlamydiales bacterium]